ncbi:TB2/DP1, HVA22 family-domain-containing protein [Fimicolochytrium jonesii]|uniref:TB2/DP1, HVA22 family-domain-containing protein n=1 Tax=Fimicolochytrium jonesii TaxID=1396493 RepID=UPI0022FE3F46|nr:TB2/DP1, HVA22 family-domain-containing protein [Fimicolochytrium jonesii]KAI8821644.1 TB2/DP1, HVA22 family-domain-containing protein [Fimicolochytrium jonesii]
MDKITPYQQQFDNYLAKFRTLNRIEAATGVPKTYFTLAIYVLVSISVFFNIWAGLTTTVLALIYPTYRAFEASSKNDVESLKVWVTYFWFLGLLSLVELKAGTILYYFPLYYVAKLVGTFLMFLPKYDGAKHLHDFILPHFEPFFKHNQKDLTK